MQSQSHLIVPIFPQEGVMLSYFPGEGGRVFLYSPCSPRTHSVDQDGLELSDLTASASQGLVLMVWTTITQLRMYS